MRQKVHAKLQMGSSETRTNSGEDGMSVEYYTVVYRIEGDKAKHDEWWQTVQPLFMADDQPVSVTAVSKADEITRMNCIEEVAERQGGDCYEMIDEIRDLIVHQDPLAWWRENAETAD